MNYEELRTTVALFGSLPGDSPLLVPIPTASGRPLQRMHVLAAGAFSRLAGAVQADLGIELLSASGWRAHRWGSREEYEQRLVAQYGSVERGKVFLAFDSPHETGLACDFDCGGLSPVSATIPQQRDTPLWKWLAANAWKHGWTPYKPEPWHWEHWMSVESYRAGVDARVEDSGPFTCSDPNDVCVETDDSTEVPRGWTHKI